MEIRGEIWGNQAELWIFKMLANKKSQFFFPIIWM